MYYKNIKSSSDGLNLSIAYSISKEKPKGIIQFSHGMAEHKERYSPFMEYLTNNGYICIINDHRGHGDSTKSQNDLENFYTNNIDYIINDLYDVTKFAKNKFNCNNINLFNNLKSFLLNVGYNDINSKLYEQLRHEILNEENNIIVYQDILKSLEIS